MPYIDEKEKEFICRKCIKFLNSADLINGNCPICNSDEDIYLNDLKKGKNGKRKIASSVD